MDARSLILQADSIARRKGLTQSDWSRRAGRATNGQTVGRILSNGSCNLNTFVELLDAIGCELEIKEL